ncbi:MAG TPA: hypothetical protein VFV00_17800 [Acidimicrobiales bacterium]|nr:hypothetical protein [Acidimicrobiales bacterium]
MLSLGRFVVGTAACAAVVGALTYGALVLRRALLPAWGGARARMAEAVVALATFFAVAQLLGAAHLFSAWAVLVGEVAGGIGLYGVGRRLGADVRLEPASPARSVPRWELVVCAIGVALVVVQWATHVAYALGAGMTHSDTLWYHQPFAATFVQQHAFTGIDGLGYDAARFFPFNAQLAHATGMLAYGRDIVSPFLNLAWLALALLAAWCIGERRRAGHVAVLGAAAVLGLPIMVATQPGQASSDIACAALLLTAVALLLEGRLDAVPVTLAGLAAGMALSTKITIAPAMALLAVAVLVVALARRRFAAAAGWSLALAVTGSFWFLRDWVVSGTPLPWFDIDAGPVHWPAQIPPQAFSLAHDVLHAQAWRDLYLDGIWQGFGRTWPIVVALLAGTSISLIVRGPGAIERLLGLTLAAGVIGYLFTPLTGGFGFVFNLRYLGPVLLVAFVLLVTVVPSGDRWRRVVLVVFGAVLVAGLTMPNRERIDAWPSGRLLPAILVLLAVGALTYAVVRRPRPAVIAGSVGLLLVGFWFAQRHYLDRRYEAVGLPNDAVNGFFRDVHDARVIVFGTDELYPLFGRTLSNRVARGDVPPTEFASFDCRAWRAELSGHADYVVVTPVVFGFYVIPPEQTFAGADRVYDADGARVYRINGPLDPNTC